MRTTVVLLFAVCISAFAQPTPPRWATAWTGSVQGPYPTGNASAQPNLSFAFPIPAAGANDQTFRMIVRPDVWGSQARIRLSNVFGRAPVTFDGVFAGIQLSGAAVLKGANWSVTFNHKLIVTIAPGEFVWSDPVTVAVALAGPGRKLAISFHVVGASGPMTWHAKALTTSYLSAPGAGSHGAEGGENAFPYSTTSWFFVDAVDMLLTTPTHTIVAFGDSITDGTASTLNGDDRWPDVLSRRVHERLGTPFAVVNAGIGGNRVVGPESYSASAPFSGGPSALQRLDRDVLSLSNVSTVIWLEGINDFNKTAGASVEAVEAGMKEGVTRMHAKGIRVIAATLTSSVGYAGGSPEQEQKRRALNEWIRTTNIFDGFVDFDKATADPQTGALRAEFVPDSTTGGAGDHLHPNRAGYMAMGMSVPLSLLSAP
jgi:lysophospholipase L1-like esterase